MKKIKLQFTTIELVPAKFNSNNILISKIKVLDENGKYIKFAKLNNELLGLLKNVTIEL